jgi:hypothetical protein
MGAEQRLQGYTAAHEKARARRAEFEGKRQREEFADSATLALDRGRDEASAREVRPFGKQMVSE